MFSGSNLIDEMSDDQWGNFAAKVCVYYSVADGGVTYADWYLPSSYELKLLFSLGDSVFNINTEKNYWTSTEGNNDTRAFSLSPVSPYIAWIVEKTNLYRVRAIRSF